MAVLALESLAAAVTGILVFAVIAGSITALTAFAYRWYGHETVPEGLAVLVGLSVIAAWLNTDAALQEAIVGNSDLLDPSVAAFTVAAFVAGGVASDLGRRGGDRLAADSLSVTGARNIDAEVSQLVRAAGRVIRVELPEEIDDIDGYDPVPEETKRDLAGTVFLFPRRITVAELERRIRTRLKDDYGVGHVDLSVAADGAVDYVAVGSRAAGIGPTLPPGSAAVAVRADPAFSASPGDRVQVFRDGPTPERVTTAELRAAVSDVATLAVDEADAATLDPDDAYRLVTLPAEASADREFASLLRAADETMAAVVVEAGSDAVGRTVGSLSVTVAAVTTADGVTETVPEPDRALAPGDTVYAVARPNALREFEGAAGSPEAEVTS
ncbi:potassium transporter TrkA [Halostella sp. JP-L12]|uniref:cation:proton antiporter regulatory subunit n=1 Tax=Halostella TaxID=1843185 RepID=UPI000EF7A031|nr:MULTISPECIES: TrkA C-terminal domain-containing protein [Halostella]NHN47021.1 potassium transporter TrkA [Halostella sp. JP-L12]